MPTKNLPLSDLILNYDLYPRTQVDSINVASLAESLEAGETLPPIVVCADTHNVIDGFHRYMAYKNTHGIEWRVPCEIRQYKNDADRLLDAVTRNARHGRRLATYEKVAAMARLKKMRVSKKLIAQAMGMRPAELTAICEGRTAMTAGNGSAKPVPIKRTISHMSGQTLTAEQVAANDKLGGNQPLFYVNQVILLCESQLIDTSNENLMDGLRQLREAVGCVLSR